MVYGVVDIFMCDYDLCCFGEYVIKEWQVIKVKEDYCLCYEILFLYFNCLVGCLVKLLLMYECFKEKGVVYEEVFGYECFCWFVLEGMLVEDIYLFK